MITGKETAVTASLSPKLHPRLTRDGRMLFYGAAEAGKRTIYIAQLGTSRAVPEKICDDCGLPLDWSPDGKKIIYWKGAPVRWFTLDVGTRKAIEIVPRIGNEIHNLQYSPNGEWVAFDVPAEGTIFITALQDGIARGRPEWIRVGAGEHPWWSADGKLIYFLSERDGFSCLWAQRLNARTGQSVGLSFVARHFHGARRTPEAASLGWGLAREHFVLPIRELTGNIWMMKPQ
jgi:Tol biopolymer transport system component